MTIHDQDSPSNHRQRMRDRFIAGEPSALTDDGLPELLLAYTSLQRDVRPLAAALIAQFNTLNGALKAPMNSLCQVGASSNTQAGAERYFFIVRLNNKRVTQRVPSALSNIVGMMLKR